MCGEPGVLLTRQGQAIIRAAKGDNRKPLGLVDRDEDLSHQGDWQRGSIASAQSLLLCVSAGAVSTASDASAPITRRKVPLLASGSTTTVRS
jgi:hypothetical protein